MVLWQCRGRKAGWLWSRGSADVCTVAGALRSPRLQGKHNAMLGKELVLAEVSVADVNLFAFRPALVRCHRECVDFVVEAHLTHGVRAVIYQGGVWQY